MHSGLIQALPLGVGIQSVGTHSRFVGGRNVGEVVVNEARGRYHALSRARSAVVMRVVTENDIAGFVPAELSVVQWPAADVAGQVSGHTRSMCVAFHDLYVPFFAAQFVES